VKKFMKKITKNELLSEVGTLIGQNVVQNRIPNPNPLPQGLPRVLAIRGIASCGKTSSINFAFHKLVHRFTPTNPRRLHPPRGLEVEFFFITQKTKELTAIITFNNAINPGKFHGSPKPIKKLGIATRGDTRDVINDTLDLFQNQACDAVIVACRYSKHGNGFRLWRNTFLQHSLIQSSIINNNFTCLEFSIATGPNINIDTINDARASVISNWV